MLRIRAALTERFAPTELTVIDDSERHAGHAGASPAGETHFSIRIRTPAFETMSRITRHRAITDALGAEFASGLHALSIDAAP